MSIVAGVDFGTLSVRVSIFSSERGRLGTARSEYPLHRRKGDPDYGTQSHADHMRALVDATHAAVLDAKRINAGIDRPLDRSHRTRHHRLQRGHGRSASSTAGRLLPLVRSSRVERGRRDYRRRPRNAGSKRFTGAAACIPPNGDSRSCFTGCATIRTSARSSRPPWNIATWSPRRCAASPIRTRVPRSVCAMGHKWMWNRDARRTAVRGVSDRRRPAACRSPRQTQRTIRDLGCDRGTSCAGLGETARAARGNSDSRRRVRRALGRGGRGSAPGERSQCARNCHLRHRDQRKTGADSRRMRRGRRIGLPRIALVSRPAYPQPAICSERSPNAATRPSPSCRTDSTSITRAKPDCCGLPGTTAIAPCW